MAMADVQGRTLEVSVIGWRDTSANTHGYHLYAVVRYGNKSCSTRTCKGGRTDAAFNDNLKFQFIEGVHEVDIAVWKKSTWGKDRLVAFRKIDLEDQMLGGWKSRKMWQLHYQPKHGADIKNAGEVYLEINCPLAQTQNVMLSPSAPYGYPYGQSSYSTEKPPGC
ncbi:uncharacterized protein LOC116248336 isoform X5 [Nymphaea colorata]|nr:uncharacterized protein LOC116248336 isoform X5 [Nymphaea colorata]